MGHYCRICGTIKPNEKFSGKGHKHHLCKVCSKLPIEERNKIDALVEMDHFWEQKFISKKNCVRLSLLARCADAEVSQLATVLLEVAKTSPSKKKRMRRIARENPSLISRLEKAGLIMNRNLENDQLLTYDYLDEYIVWDEYCAMKFYESS